MTEAAEKNEKLRAHAPVPASVDVAIVGAGLGGLMAGARLARHGFRVACFEQHYVAGGCATQFSRGPKKARYNFDVGLHYIGDCGSGGAIPTMLRDVGVELSFRELDRDGFDTLVFPGLTFKIPADVDLYRERLLGFFPGQKRGIDRYVRLLRSTMKAMSVLEKHQGKVNLRSMFAMAFDGMRIAGIQAKTIAEVFEACHIDDPRLRAVMLGQSGDYGLPPSHVSAVLHLGLAGHYFRGAFYPEGGGQVIADRLAETIEASGGSVHLRRGVNKILFGSDGAANGVRLEPRAGNREIDVRAKVVLSNADLKMTYERLVGPEHVPSGVLEKTRDYTMPAAIFITFLGVKGDLKELGMRPVNYWQFDDFDVEGQYKDSAGKDGFRARAAYITSGTLKDPANARHHAPGGISTVEVMTLVPGNAGLWGSTPPEAEMWAYKESALYRERKAAVEEQMISRLDALFPGAAKAVVFRESATPVTHTRYTRGSEGTSYGIAATPGQFLKNRPGYRSPVRGLYLAGASTRAGHGILGAMSSGRNAATRIAADLGRPFERR